MKKLSDSELLKQINDSLAYYGGKTTERPAHLPKLIKSKYADPGIAAMSIAACGKA